VHGPDRGDRRGDRGVDDGRCERGSRRGTRPRRRANERTRARAAPRRSGRDQGHHRRRRHADDRRRATVRPLPPVARRHARGPAADRRGRDRRQDRRDAVCLPRPGRDPQSLGARSHAGRVVVGIGRGRRGSSRAGRDRDPDDRLDPAAGGVLWRRRAERRLRRRAARRRPAARSLPRPRRADRAERCRRHARRERADRPPDPRGSRTAAASRGPAGAARPGGARAARSSRGRRGRARSGGRDDRRGAAPRTGSARRRRRPADPRGRGRGCAPGLVRRPCGGVPASDGGVDRGRPGPRRRVSRRGTARAGRLREKIAPWLASFDALLSPVAPGPAPALGAGTGDPTLCAPWTHAGLPALSLPTGLDAAGLPLAVQLVGGAGRLEPLLAAAAWCERVLRVDARPRPVGQ
jgi:hypothetical protein